jgi:hypothetical protein
MWPIKSVQTRIFFILEKIQIVMTMFFLKIFDF